MTSLIGYNVHSVTDGIQRPYSDVELRALFDHLKALKPKALLFLDNREWAQEAKRILPECNVILRFYYNQGGVDEGTMWERWSVQQHLDFFASKHVPGTILNMWNEPVPGSRGAFAERYASMMNAFGQINIPLVGPNFGVGFPNENVTEWLARLEPMWDAFDRWDWMHFYGAHEYGTHRGMLFSEPNHAYNVFPWRVGRQTHLVFPYLESQGHLIPRTIYTEFGGDSAFDGTNFRGYRSYPWAGTRYAQELHAAADVLDKKYPNKIQGFCVFSHGDTGRRGSADDWSSFNVMPDTEFKNRLVELYRDTAPPPPPTEEPPPLDDVILPDDMEVPARAVLHPPKAEANVRRGAGTAYDIRFRAYKNEIYTVYLDSMIFDEMKRYKWIFIESEDKSKRGWIALTIPIEEMFRTIENVNKVILPVKPPVDASAMTREERRKVAEYYRFAIDVLQYYVDEMDKLDANTLD